MISPQPMELLLFILCLSAPLYVASTLSSDGLTLLSLLTHLTSVPPSLKSSWNSSDSTHCSWIGIRCDQYGKVISLNLTAYSIFGQLGPEIGQLTHLQNLVLVANGFSGTIPLESGNCSLLKYIDLSDNSFSGSIPSSLGLLLKISILRLAGNHLSGTIPPEIGNCKSLKKLHLYSNQLGGPIPNELGGLSNLEDLELYSNNLTGEIPLTIWKIRNLKHVILHNNSLSGKLPSEMTKLKHLKNISFFDNQFSGSIPQNLGINSSLVKLDLMNNTFTGDIPPNLCFGKQLHTLSLGLNQLQGAIPQDLGRCATLGRLVLNENNLSGSLPVFESNQNLIYVDMSKNNISGVIPSSLGNCTSLQALIFSTNNITGLIPTELGNLVNLQALNLAHNNLEGPLPQELSYCTKMLTFDVGFNFLNGSFPSGMKSWTGLTQLILRENHFTGVIPSFLSEYDQLLELQLGGNMFVGKIPPSIGSLPNLLYGLNLSDNKLSGEIPSELGKLQKLQSLDISLNNLTGVIHVLGELSSLIEVNISYNSFFGPLPEWSIQHLNLSPSSVMGNPGLCVYCSTSNGFSCANSSPLKPCDFESAGHEGSRRSILFAALGFVGFVICLSGILLIYDHHCGQPSRQRFGVNVLYDHYWKQDSIRGREFGQTATLEDDFLCQDPEASYSSDKGDFGIIGLKNATENFDDKYIIGEGAHGKVYKAELGVGVFAIKKVKFEQSNRRKLNMIKEVEMTRKIRHQNVARSLGSWIGDGYGLTISRYMENGSLHDVLHENNPLPYLAWNVRYKIAFGIAKGLAYLHHNFDPPILHRDIKPKNILLDSDMQPYITDFGISIALNQSSTVMHMRSTYHLGTIGFMAPEIAYAIVPRYELDIYSYGVVLLELITRKKVLDDSFVEEETTLVGWIKSVWRGTRKLEEIVDSGLARELSDVNVKAQVIKVLLVALICTQKDPRKRLKMIDIVEFYETPTDPGILVRQDNDSFHVGNSIVTALASLFFQEEVNIPAKKGSSSALDEVEATADPNNLNIIRRGPPGVVSRVQTSSGEIFSEMKLTFAKNLGNILSAYAEVGFLRMIRHRNIVKMLDCRINYDYILIRYEYMENGNLHDLLHKRNPSPPLNWAVRYKIATGIARGLAYLHYYFHRDVVHCAIKPKNILLDFDMEPHIADFSSAKLLDGYPLMSSPSSSTLGRLRHITTENAPKTEITREFDVYSYGVVLLQLITRKKAVDQSFISGSEIGVWVRRMWREAGDIFKIVDSSLAEELLNPGANVFEQVTKLLSMALSCTEEDPSMRPTMIDVINEFDQAPEASYSSDTRDFKITNLINATKNFDDKYIIGKEGHGIVYKAELGIGVFAIKKVNFGQSNWTKSDMVKEVEMTWKIRHQNVARSLGYWIGDAYGLTISRYMENGSLHDVLHENNPLPYLAWNVRYKIAFGIAKGLAYLHHDFDRPILHRDINPKNILLDSDMQPCITDFGISFPLKQSSAVMQMWLRDHPHTPGFMAPEIADAIVPSCELDIYGYGVVLLELITRKKVLDDSFVEEETTLVGWIKSVWRRTITLEEIVDSGLARELSDINVKAQVIKVLLVALICTQEDPRKILKMIDIVEFYETPTDPGIFVRHDNNPFHLGNSVVTALASLFFQEEVQIAANEGSSSALDEVQATADPNNLNIIRRGTPGVVSKVQTNSGAIFSEMKLPFAGNLGNISSAYAEVGFLKMIRHRNIVSMLGCWFNDDHILVRYEYLKNGNLHDLLHKKDPPPPLNWAVRYKIATGIAHGLAYLHYYCDPPVVHCAIKPKNILLGYFMEPLIAGFSSARRLRSSSTIGRLRHITPAITREFDVYSYGVVLLQLITRKKALDQSFMSGCEIGVWVRSLWREAGDIFKIVDTSLAEELRYSRPSVFDQATKVLSMALSCTEEDPSMRPTMRDVSNELVRL